ncbi:MAG: diacylglycerol kinase [Bacteroidales bacterium]|nr:diacylglycerol kinase [Bacteroidales bacterium]
MEISHADYTLQVGSSSLQNVMGGLRKVFVSDPGLPLQLFITIPIIAAGIVLQMNAVQWLLIIFVTLLFLVAGICRTAALLQVSNDTSLSSFQASRIKCMGTAIVVITAGLSLFTYLMVFVPKIITLL